VRLASLGFEQVYDYVGGKADWGAAGLPLEGLAGSGTRVGAHARRDVPVCRLDERLQEIRRRVGGWNVCFVVDADGVVLGRVGRSALRRDDDVSVEQAMSEGPSTIRPSARLEPVVERMRARDLTSLPVTLSDGRLLGLLLRDDAEAALKSEIWRQHCLNVRGADESSTS
jgi:Mg/Co/Ni transporter MgtE